MQKIFETYAQHGIQLAITPKRIKNINFRLKPLYPTDEPPFTTLMTVSYPIQLPKNALIQSLYNRLAWAIDCQRQQLKRQSSNLKKSTYFNDIKDLKDLTLENSVYFEGKKITVHALFERHFNDLNFTNIDIPHTLVSIYKFWLIGFIANRQALWQDKVGKSATKITPYRMKTRWGSCSTQAKTIRLSIWLAQFEPSCTDYVMVHELCHLHEANHSPRFWAWVEKAMPDYKIWHKMLKNGLGNDI